MWEREKRGAGYGSFLVPLLAAVSDISPLPFCHLTQHSLWSHFTFYIFYIYISRLTFWSELSSSFSSSSSSSSLFSLFLYGIPCLSISISLVFLHNILHCCYSLFIWHNWTRRAEIVSAISFWNKFHIAHISSIYRYVCESGHSTRSADGDIKEVCSELPSSKQLYWVIALL